MVGRRALKVRSLVSGWQGDVVRENNQTILVPVARNATVPRSPAVIAASRHSGRHEYGDVRLGSMGGGPPILPAMLEQAEPR